MEEDITDRIRTYIRTTKDVTYTCPKCKYDLDLYDVEVGEYNSYQCHKCGYKVKFYVNDFM